MNEIRVDVLGQALAMYGCTAAGQIIGGHVHLTSERLDHERIMAQHPT